MDFKSYVEASERNEADESELDNSDEVPESDSEQSIQNDEQRNKLSDDFYSRFGFVEIESENLNAETMHRHLIHDSFKIKEPDYEDVQVCKYETLPEKISEDPSTSEATLESTKQDENVLLVNPRALSKDAKTYELEKFEKKLLVIFNQFNVDGYKHPRHGTHEDVKVLTNTFEKLGFEVVEHTDYTKDEIFAELKTFTSKNFVDYGCVAVAVLTHGSHHGLLRAKDDQYSEQVIIEHLKVHNNPTLITKPKMLIIQACRGDMSLKGVEVYKQTGRMHTDAFEEVEHYSLPIAADMVVVHSTFFGNPANRCLVTGSWFIQTLCEKIDLLAAEMDFEAIFKEVQNTIAIEKFDPVYNRLTQAMDINKQMPTILSSLIRKLYLRKFMESSTDSSDFQMTQEILTPVTPMPATPSEEPSSLTTKVSFATEVTRQYFDYLKECLRRYVEENSEDKIAQSLFMVADTFGNGKKFKESKKKMCSAICQHLISNSEKIPHYQHLFICESYLL